MEINIHVHQHGTDAQEQLDRIEHMLVLDRQTEERHFMATKKEFDDLNDAYNTETNRLATKIDELIAKIAAGGMTAEEEAQVLAEFTATSARLKSIGADPADPIPAP